MEQYLLPLHEQAGGMDTTAADKWTALVVVIDVNPSHWTMFWTPQLIEVDRHEGNYTCRYNTHGWIV
jgi:hypothetical protein